MNQLYQIKTSKGIITLNIPKLYTVAEIISIPNENLNQFYIFNININTTKSY